MANWPAARVGAWSVYLVARAIENQCYVGGVNRVGADGKGIEHSGGSALIDPYGRTQTNLMRMRQDGSTATGTNGARRYRAKFRCSAAGFFERRVLDQTGAFKPVTSKPVMSKWMSCVPRTPPTRGSSWRIRALAGNPHTTEHLTRITGHGQRHVNVVALVRKSVRKWLPRRAIGRDGRSTTGFRDLRDHLRQLLLLQLNCSIGRSNCVRSFNSAGQCRSNPVLHRWRPKRCRSVLVKRLSGTRPSRPGRIFAGTRTLSKINSPVSEARRLHCRAWSAC